MDTSKPIHIQANDDAERAVVITPADNSTFVQTGMQVIAACQIGIGIKAWFRELNALFDHVSNWVDQRPQVRRFYLSPSPAKVSLYFVPTSDVYDAGLADDLVELDIELSRLFNIGAFEVHQIPASEIERFVDPNVAKSVDGPGRSAHRAVDA